MEQLLLAWVSVNGALLFGIGVVAAIIGVMFGAAGFILLPALLLVGIPIHATVAVNKFATGVSSFSTVITLIAQKKVSLRSMLPLMLFASLGGLSGALLATRMSAQTLNIAAIILLIIMFLYSLKMNKGKITVTEEETTQFTRNRSFRQRLILTVTPFFIGIYDGGMGPGSALLNITYFLKQHYSYLKAAEMTRFLMFASCISAFFFYYFSGIVDWAIAIPVMLGSIVGSHVGLKIIPYLNVKWIQMLLPFVFLLLIAQVAVNLFQ